MKEGTQQEIKKKQANNTIKFQCRLLPFTLNCSIKYLPESQSIIIL